MRILLIFFAFTLAIVPANAQETELPDEARFRIDYLIGTWDVYDETLDDDGNVISTTHAINHTEYFLGDSVLQSTIIPDEGDVRKTIRFYDKEKEIFYEIGVGKEGDVYILQGGLEEYIMTFTFRSMYEGNYPIGRFHHFNVEPDSFEAVMEISIDGGETWRPQKNNRQRLVRRAKP